MPEPEKPTITKPEVVALEPPTREISQIDHINKKLLTSLFKRMDEDGDISQPDNNTTEDDEWKD